MWSRRVIITLALRECVQRLLVCVFNCAVWDCLDWIFRCEEHLYKRLRLSVGRSVPHDAMITWKTSYVAIASRRGGGRGNWLRRDSITSRFLRTEGLGDPLVLMCFCCQCVWNVKNNFDVHYFVPFPFRRLSFGCWSRSDQILFFCQKKILISIGT